MNGNEYLADLEVEEKIKGMGVRELLEFNARRRKESGIIGGSGAFFGAAIASVVAYFTRGGS